MDSKYKQKRAVSLDIDKHFVILKLVTCKHTQRIHINIACYSRSHNVDKTSTFNSHLSVNNAPRAKLIRQNPQDVMLCSFYKRVNDLKITYLHWSVQTGTRVEFSVYLTHIDRVTGEFRPASRPDVLSAPADQKAEDWLVAALQRDSLISMLLFFTGMRRQKTYLQKLNRYHPSGWQG